MRQIKLLGLALVAVFALASVVMATSAMATELPDIHVALGEAFPVTTEGSLKGKEVAKITTAVSSLTAEEVTSKLEIKELTALGKGTVIFRGVGLGATKCNTEGAAVGEVVLPGLEWHIVFLVGPTFDIDLLFSAFTILCNKLKIKISGSIIAKLVGVEKGKELTSAKVEMNCAKGSTSKQELETFTNDEGKELSKLLVKADFGLGAENGCMSTTEPLTHTSNKMIEFL